MYFLVILLSFWQNQPFSNCHSYVCTGFCFTEKICKSEIIFLLSLFLYTEASNVHSNKIIRNSNEVEMMEIKTEPNQSDELYSDGENSNTVDINSRECVTDGKMN